MSVYLYVCVFVCLLICMSVFLFVCVFAADLQVVCKLIGVYCTSTMKTCAEHNLCCAILHLVK